MLIKSQAIRLTDISRRLEDCINAIMNTGDLSEWMSPDGIALLKNTMADIEDRKPSLERLINTPPNFIKAYFDEEDLEPQIQSYESLFSHLTSTLKFARGRQQLPKIEDSERSLD
ncbi:hypothetical protein [Deinococcus sp. UYEF24]